MTTQTAAAKNKKRKLSLKTKDALQGYLFLTPSFLSLILFMVVPILASFAISTFEWDFLSPPAFKGLSNYKGIFQDEVFLISLVNTVKWVIIYVPLSIVTSFVLALAMDMPIKGIGVFRGVFYLPVVAPIVVISLLFMWLYNEEFGAINYILSFIGIPKIGWLNDSGISLFSVALMAVWKWAGYNMLIFLSAMQGIPVSLYEAAELDGITPLKKLLYIKIPLLMPAIYFVVLTCVIDAFQIFTEVYIMTSGGPGYSTHTVSYYIWASAFRYSHMGEACAMAVVMFVIIMAVTIVQDRLLNKRVQYDA